MKRWLALLGACLALALVGAGCGGDDDNDNGDTGGGGAAAPAAPKTTEGTGGGGGGGAKASQVTMKSISFQPGDLAVKKGATVTWTNDDTVGHDVTKTGGPGPDFKSGDPGGLQPGDTYKQTFKTPGTIQYVCTVHPGMEGTITVK
jgi:plastocyanin